jgi:hypothetical protein
MRSIAIRLKLTPDATETKFGQRENPNFTGRRTLAQARLAALTQSREPGKVLTLRRAIPTLRVITKS